MSVRTLLCGLGLCLTLVASSAHAGEGVFTVPTLSQARDEAGTERLALVFLTDGTGDDSVFMENEVWTHPDVRAWVGEHAVAAKVDSKSFHGASLQGNYRIETFPALLAFKDGELARQVEGPLESNKLLAWLEVVRVGDVQAADMVLSAGEDTSTAPSSTEIDVEAHIVKALEAPNPERAISTLLSAWHETVGSPQQAERRPRLCEAMEPYLISDDARALVLREREAAWARHKRRRTLPDLLDWIALNDLINDHSETTLPWVQEMAKDKKRREWITQVLYSPQDPLGSVLAKRGHWTLYGDNIRDPIELVDLRQKVHRETKITITGAESAADRDNLRRELSGIVVALLSSRRDKEARAASDHIVAEDKEYGPTLVALAIEAKQPRRWMRSLLNPNRAEQVQLAMKLTEELEMR